MHVRVVGIANRIAIVGGHLPEAVKIQLTNEASDVARLEDGPTRVQVFRLEFLVIKENGIAIRAPPNRPGLALVHYPPELLRESHRLQDAMVLEHSWSRLFSG